LQFDCKASKDAMLDMLREVYYVAVKCMEEDCKNDCTWIA